MLQGGPGTSRGYFEPLVTLSEERPVVLYDALDDESAPAPGPPAPEWNLAYPVSRFCQVRSALGLSKVHVLGYAWGALAALEYALTQPRGLASLILDPVDPAAFIRHVCLSLQARVMQPAALCGPTDRRLARLNEINVPTLLIWEESAGGAGDVSRCENRLLPGWELAVLPSAFGAADHEERFTQLVQRFLARVEDGDTGNAARAAD
jgi:pimeloyl-ACP methyl ester carboxylesterase